jgi:hypothetical protein
MMGALCARHPVCHWRSVCRGMMVLRAGSLYCTSPRDQQCEKQTEQTEL